MHFLAPRSPTRFALAILALLGRGMNLTAAPSGGDAQADAPKQELRIDSTLELQV